MARPLTRTQAVDGRDSLGSVSPPPPEYYLFTFGDNTAGQLLTNEPYGISVSVPHRVSRIQRQRVTYLACGDQTSFVVTENGDVLAGGANECGQISLATDDEAMERLQRIDRPVKLEKFVGRDVRYVASGAEHTVVVLENGAALSYGTNEYGQLGQGEAALSLTPRPPGAVHSLIHRGGVCTVACGRYFTLFLTRWGEVYACGDNTNGCLGTPSLTSSSEPKRIPGLAGSPITQIACGDDHCLALSLEGKIYGWGRCGQGELGLGKDTGFKVVYEPRAVPVGALPRGRAKKIIAGASHSIIIASDGEIWTAGQNSSGQCGFDPDTFPTLHGFRRVEGLPPTLRWLMGSAGQAHSCLVSATGRAFTFGRNLEGQLGCGKLTPFEYEPKEIQISSRSSQLFVYGCAAGAYHTVLTALPISIDPASMNELVRLQSTLRTSPSSSPETPGVRAVTDLPTPDVLSAVPSVPLFRQESDVRPRKHSKRVLCALQDAVISVEKMMRTHSDTSEITRALPRVPTVEVNILQDLRRGEAAPPQAGYRADDLLKMYRKAQRKNQLDQFRLLLSSLFSNATRLNCSFLMKVRDPELDVLGLEAFYTELAGQEGFDARAVDRKSPLYTVFESIKRLIEDTLPIAEYLKEADQVRFLLIALHCPVFGALPMPSEVGTCLNSLYTIFRKMPCSGRRVVFEIISNLYPAPEFQRRLVDPCRRLVAFILPRHVGKVLTTVEDLWDLMLFLEMCWLSNEAVAAQQRMDESSKRPGKISPESFAVQFPPIQAIDPASELKVMLESAELARQERRMAPAPGVVGPNPLHSSYGETNPSAQGALEGGVEATRKAREENDQTGESCAWRFAPSDSIRVEGSIPVPQRFFLAHSNLLPVTFKRDVLRAETQRRRWLSLERTVQLAMLNGEPIATHFDLVVRRDSVVQDALRQISLHHGASLLKPLRVHFVGEEGVDEGGLKREFFSLICDQMFDPNFGMFTYDKEARCVWFTLTPVEGQGLEFALVGILMGLALYNDVILDLKFPPAVYKKIQGVPTDFSDLVDVRPEMADGLRKMLEMDCSTPEGRQVFEDSLGMLTFTWPLDFFGEAREIPLKEGGEEVYLTPENRAEYVELVVDFWLNKGICASFQDFKTGFLCIWNTDLLRVLTPSELQTLLVGIEELNFDDLERGARYEGYNPEQPYMKEFWKILKSWDPLLKRRFLHYCTGSDRCPIGGLQELHLVVQRNGSEPINSLPTALTCFNRLLLPEYEDSQKLERLLKMAVELAEGFGLR